MSSQIPNARTIVSLCVLLPGLAAAGQAQAHAHLLSATPAANAMAMPAPTELRLKFSEGLEIKFTKAIVKGPGKAAVKTGPQTLDPKDATVLIVPLPAALPDGDYTVDWQALSTDGHKTKGHYGFQSMQ